MAAAVFAVMTMALLVPWQLRTQERTVIEHRLADEAQLIAELLAAARDLTEADMDREADRLGTLVSGRVTLIARDGRVVGDSTQTPAELETSRTTRPGPRCWPRAAAVSASSSATAPPRRPTWSTWRSGGHPVVKYVRVALPLTDVNAQLATSEAPSPCR